MRADSQEHKATETHQNVSNTILELAQESRLIIRQLKKLIAQHSTEENIITELNKAINEVIHLNSNTILLDFKKAVEDGKYLLPNFVKKFLIGFVEMELSGHVMEAIASDKLNSTEILEYIKEGEKYAAKVKKLDIVVFVGNTGAGKSTMVNALEGRKMVWAKYFGVTEYGGEQVEYEEETLFDLPEIKRLDVETIQSLQNRIKGWDIADSIKNFFNPLRRKNIQVTTAMEELALKAINNKNSNQNVNYKRRVIQVDAREGKKSALASIGHSLESKTLYPQIYKGSSVMYCDCPGFCDTRTQEIEIANSVNIMQTVEQARSVKVVILITFDSLKPGAGRAKGLTELWGIIQNLFGDPDNVVKYRDSILINISHVPEMCDENFPNSLHHIVNALGEKAELVPLLERVVICDPLDRMLSVGSISLAEFSNKIKSLKPIRNPSRVFRTAMSKATGNALVLFAHDAKDDILKSMNVGDFESTYNKLHYLMQLSALKDAPLNYEIKEIKRRVAQQLSLIVDTIHSGREANDLDSLAKKIYKGISLDHLLGVDIVKQAYFKTKLLLLKFLLKQPIFQKQLIDKHIEDMYCMMNYFDMPSCPPVVSTFIDDLFFKGNEVAIFPNIAKKAEKLFNKFNAYLQERKESRYGVVTASDFEKIGQLAQIPAQEIFNLLKNAGWLIGGEDSREARIAISEQALLARDIQIPSELNTTAVKKEVLELFKKHLLIDTFFAKKFLKFKEDQGLSKPEVVNSIVNTIGNQIEIREYKLYQVKSLLAQYFSHEKAVRYLGFLSSLKLLDADLASKRYKLLKKIIENFQILNDTLTQVSSHVPVGSVHMIPSNHVPSGFKECNGQWLPVNAYAALYNVIRDTFGELEEGGKKFRLPDYRGYFLRGNNKPMPNDILDCGLLKMQANPSQDSFGKLEMQFQGKNALLLFNNQLFYADQVNRTITKLDSKDNNQYDFNVIKERFTNSYELANEDQLMLITNITGRTHKSSNPRLFNAVQNDTTRLPRDNFVTSLNGSHTHSVDTRYFSGNPAFRGAISYGGKDSYSYNDNGGAINSSGEHDHKIKGGDPETRPKNYPVTYVMKC